MTMSQHSTAQTRPAQGLAAVALATFAWGSLAPSDAAAQAGPKERILIELSKRDCTFRKQDGAAVAKAARIVSGGEVAVFLFDLEADGKATYDGASKTFKLTAPECRAARQLAATPPKPMTAATSPDRTHPVFARSFRCCGGPKSKRAG